MQQNKDGEQKLSKLLGHFSVVAILSITSLHAASFEDFKKTQKESFQKYKDERDNQFNKYLKEQWKAFNVYKGTPLYEEPKPSSIKPAIAKPFEKVGPLILVKIKEPSIPAKQSKPQIIEKPVIEKPKVDKPIIAEKPKPQDKITLLEIPKIKEDAKLKEIVKQAPKRDIEFDFFGKHLGFDISKGLKSAQFQPRNKIGITNFFDKAASSEYNTLLAQIKDTKQELGLNDWGVYLLVKEIAEQTYSNQNEADLLSWFLFNKLGYSVKIGLVKDRVVLMHYSSKIIYSTPNYTIDKKKYYVIANYNKGSVGQLYSYEQNYPGADKALDLALPTLPLLPENTASKVLDFEYETKKYKIPFDFNQNIVDFMATYPQADYETFFNAPLEIQTYESVAKELKRIVDGKKASEAMNIVLSFVQKSFEYQTDDEQFKREKVMFAQETLYFDKSDCEDRAILFSYLTKELFGVNVVGVKYKDHMATALYVPIDGDKVKYASREYVLADPTYINSNIGQSMPKYKPLKPESFVRIQN